MKIIFSTGYIESSLGATPKIAFQIADFLQAQSNTCSVLGCNYVENITLARENGATLESFVPKNILYKENLSLQNLKSKFWYIKNEFLINILFAVFHPIYALKFFSKKTKIEGDTNYLGGISEFIDNKKIDFLVCTQEPFLLNKAVIDKYHTSHKIVLYQLDPWGFHELETLSVDKNTRRIQELDAFEKVAHILTTPVLYELYSQDVQYQKYIEKMTVVEFPNILNPAKSATICPINFDKKFINIVFSGVVSDVYRCPKHILDIIEKLILANEKIRVYFVGIKQTDILPLYTDKYPDNIFSVEKVDTDTAFSIMKQADFLLNIGNTLTNQTPSKIFDYFSIGKPILNIQKAENDCSINYFEKYPLQFTIKEFEKTDTISLLAFLKENKNNYISFEAVEKIFFTSTPEYVSRQILSVLKKL